MQALTAELSSAVTIEDVHAAVAATGRAVIGADAVSIGLLDPGSDRSRCGAQVSPASPNRRSNPGGRRRGLSGRAVLADGQARFLDRVGGAASLQGRSRCCHSPRHASGRGGTCRALPRRPRVLDQRAGAPARHLRPDRKRTHPGRYPGTGSAYGRGAPASPLACQSPRPCGGPPRRLLPARERGRDRRRRLVRRRRARRRDDRGLGRRRRRARDPRGRADGRAYATPTVPTPSRAAARPRSSRASPDTSRPTRWRPRSVSTSTRPPGCCGTAALDIRRRSSIRSFATRRTFSTSCTLHRSEPLDQRTSSMLAS